MVRDQKCTGISSGLSQVRKAFVHGGVRGGAGREKMQPRK